MEFAGRILCAACWLAICAGSVDAQPPFSPVGQFELSGSVHLDEVDGAVRAHLERIKAFVAEEQWDEAVETLRQVMENHGSKVMQLTDRRFINLADYCSCEIAALPEPALALYRQRVDPLARQAYDQGVAQRDFGLLSNVVNQMFCSSVGDKALLILGDLSLEQGRPSLARSYWEKIFARPPERIPVARFEAATHREAIDPADRDAVAEWYQRDETVDPAVYRLRRDNYLPDAVADRLVRFWRDARLPPTRLAYPDSSLDRADVRARLVLASIMEGALARATTELAAFKRLHPAAIGTLAGRTEPYADSLGRLLDDAAGWPARTISDDWPTFAGNSQRDRAAQQIIDVGAQAWAPISLGDALAAEGGNGQKFISHRVAERSDGLLSYHPVIAEGLVLFQNSHQIFAFDLHTGQPAWPGNPKKTPGEIYAEESAIARSRVELGVPRFTLTVADGKLYARTGSQVTARPVEAFENSAGALVCLDLHAQGRQVWRITPDDDKWAFEGAPLVEGTDVYVSMRKSDVRPQSHVACFDAETGRIRWRTMIASAETPAGGQVEELTHNLLTLDQGVLYINSNLGAVAAVSASDGRTLWISTYPRARRASAAGQEKRAAHFYRDLNPCLYFRGCVLAAPSDSEYVLAFDAATGQLLWQTHLAVDAVHLLGTGAGNLIASGNHLWWIDLESGKVVGKWPEQSPQGYGRGILAGDKIYWPTRDALYVFLQRIVRPGHAPLVRDPIPLGSPGRNASGGNLLISGGLLLIAADRYLYAFGEQAGRGAVAAGDPRERSTPAAPLVAPGPE